ncbi:MAG TPA: hypothetical protein VHN12_00945 [Geobacteraceae bacterium]|nr:hypothetical protein [Geobacteraceae bacterium]
MRAPGIGLPVVAACSIADEKKGNSCLVTLRRTAFRCSAGLAALLGIAASTVALAVYRPQLFRTPVERALPGRAGVLRWPV